MRTSLRGRIAIMAHEAIVETRYRDTKGIWTIGVGVTAAAGASINPDTFKDKISVQQSVDMFELVLRKYERDVNRAINVHLSQHQFDALVSFHYNTGAIRRCRATKLINAGNYEAGGKALMGYSKPPEIIERRMKEVQLFLHGDYGSELVSVYPANRTGRVLWSKGRIVNAKGLLKPEFETNILPTPPRPAPTVKDYVEAPDQQIEELLREEGSRTIKQADQVEGSSRWTRLWATISGGSLAPVFYFLEGVPSWVKAVVAVAILAAIVIGYLEWRQAKAARAIRAARVDDAKSGKNLSRLQEILTRLEQVNA